MAESPEHRFLKEAVLQVLVDFSSVRLFGVTEAQRRTFDFSCNLERDWTLPLVGQVDWRHRGGLEKDLRTLLDEPGTPLRVLVMRDDMAHRLRLTEIVKGREHRRPDMFTLKVFPITPDFDADREDHRTEVQQDLRHRIVNDILFNVVFGGISPDHVRFFAFGMARLRVNWTTIKPMLERNHFGTFGTTLALLHHLASQGFISNNDAASALKISSAHVREAVLILEGSGFVARSGKHASRWRVTLRGRVFRELLGRIRLAIDRSEWAGELGYIIDRLGCEAERSVAVQGTRPNDVPAVLDFLVSHILAAETRWNLDLTADLTYHDLIPEGAFASFAPHTDAGVDLTRTDGAPAPGRS